MRKVHALLSSFQVLEFVDEHGNEVLNLGSFALLPQHVVRLILAREELKADEFSKFQVLTAQIVTTRVDCPRLCHFCTSHKKKKSLEKLVHIRTFPFRKESDKFMCHSFLYVALISCSALPMQAALMWSKKYCDSTNSNLHEVLGSFLEYIHFHVIPANVLMKEIHPLGLVPSHIIMNALAYQVGE